MKNNLGEFIYNIFLSYCIFRMFLFLVVIFICNGILFVDVFLILIVEYFMKFIISFLEILYDR